jgi:putative hydrolase of the HAD superfamily
VGFTLTSFDSARIAAVAREEGIRVDPGAVAAAERPMRAELAAFAWPHVNGAAPAAAPGGAAFLARLLELAGALAPADARRRAAERLWAGHLRHNLWSHVMEGVEDALRLLRGAGLRLGVVSNAEGTVEAMLGEVGLRPYLDTVVDSWVVGHAKPAPRIFEVALDRLGVIASAAVMVGDSPSADIAGAAAAGIPAVLLDPYGLHPAAEVPRYPNLLAFTEALVAPGGT